MEKLEGKKIAIVALAAVVLVGGGMFWRTVGSFGRRPASLRGPVVQRVSWSDVASGLNDKLQSNAVYKKAYPAQGALSRIVECSITKARQQNMKPAEFRAGLSTGSASNSQSKEIFLGCARSVKK